MKAPLATALGLHALLLFAGARWAPASVRELPPPVELAAEVAVEAAPPPPPPVEEAPRGTPPAPAGPTKSAAPGPPGRGPARPTSGGAALVQSEEPPPPPAEPPAPETLDSWLHAYGERIGIRPVVPVDVGTAAERDGAGTGTAAEGDGGGGGGGKGTGRRHGTAWGEGWDHVATDKAGDRETVVAQAGEATLSQGTIAGVVARSSARVALCFQAGVRRDPTLAGRIPVRFTVDARGNVVLATDGGSTVGDPTVIRCVLAAFTTMTFPAREKGEPVQATYLVAYPPG